MTLDIIKLFVSIIICQIAGLITIVINSKVLEPWYVKLKKPPFSVPNWLVAPIWGALYMLMGISFFIIWSEGVETEGVKFAMILFAVHIFFDIITSYVFYVKKSPSIAVVNELVLTALIIAIIVLYFAIKPIAGYLVIPQLVWNIYLLVESVSIEVLNQKNPA